jgi:glyoxylase-like metal-dependent hydrolase (beta-lactamase superfamily II)
MSVERPTQTPRNLDTQTEGGRVQEVADRVYRLGGEYVNWFLVDDGGSITVVDAGTPSQYRQLPTALSRIGRSMDDLHAIVLTHAHGDHLGSSARIVAESRATVHVHEDDEALARGKAHREYERHFVRDLGHWFAWKSLLFFVRGGATKAPPVDVVAVAADGATLDVPGQPHIIHTPGHTHGSSCILMHERGVIFTGDALVTLSITTGATGPMIMPGSFNMDSPQSLASLDRLRGVTADAILPGHGEPWSGAMGLAIDQAIARGAH